MKIYLQDKTTVIENPNTEKGKLIPDTIHIHNDEVPFIADKGHYETIKEYDNGGKDVQFIIDKRGQAYKPAEDYDEDILVYIPYTKEELEQIELSRLRQQRETECFPIVNRGNLWYNKLTSAQLIDLDNWYQAWLNAPETNQVPIKPEWIN